MDAKNHVYNPNPRVKANLFSIIYTCWITPLLTLGRKKPLEQEDLYETLPQEKAEILTEELEKVWDKEMTKKNPNLIRAIASVYFKRIFLLSLLPLIVESLALLDPILISYVIEYFNDQIDTKMAIYYGSRLFFNILVDMTLLNPYYYHLQRFGMQIRVALSGLIYKKVTKISANNTVEATTGKIINLLSNDVGRIELSILFGSYIYVSPLIGLTIITILIIYVDYSILCGLGIFLLLMPFQSFLSRIMSRYKNKTSKLTDERINMTNEVLNGIKIIKMYCWEKPFTEIVEKIRRKELLSQMVIYMISGLNCIIDTDLTSLITFSSIAVFIFIVNKPLSPSIIVFILGYYYKLCTLIGFYFVRSLTNFISGRVSCHRVQDFLLQPEVKYIKNTDAEALEKSVEVKNLHASWNTDEKTNFLKNISFTVKPNEMMAIVGSVGSGKSSLLMALMGEMPSIVGDVKLNGSVFYVSQEPWIFPSTIKQNIIFGKEYNKMKFNEIIKICALREDFKLFPNGEDTLIGDKGVSLSGGQRARISLARALYNDPDIYLLDDPLSAVDANVGKHLFDKCLNGYLKSKIRILVTHQIHHLVNADHIVLIHNGEVRAQGTFEELENEAELNLNNLLTDIELESTSVLSRIVERQHSKPSESSMAQFGSILDLSNRNSTAVAVKYDDDEYEEEHTTGTISCSVFSQIFKNGMGIVGVVFIFLIFLTCQAFSNGADYWLSYWASKEEEIHLKFTKLEECNKQLNLTTVCKELLNSTNMTLTSGTFADRSTYFNIYSIIIICLFVTVLIRTISFYTFFYIMEKSLHKRLFDSIIKAKSRFFDLNPLGRIMNRFSKDIGNLDDILPLSLFEVMQCSSVIIGVFVLGIVSNYWILIPIVPLVIAFVYIRTYFMSTARELKRIEGLCNSPIFIHASNTITGLLTIRTCKNEKKVKEEFSVHLNRHTETFSATLSVGAWFALRLEIIVVIYAFIIIFSSILAKDFTFLQPGQVGLILIYNYRLMLLFQWVVRESAKIENLLLSLERIVEYSTVKGENLHSAVTKTNTDWPKNGEILFKDVSFAYDENLPNVLKNLSLKINAKEKIGIVGRTGAGKSTIFQTLFRMAEPSGTVLIDDINIKDISLHELRSKIAIIPQEPTLFIGTLRYNLDPFGQYDDNTLWNTLETVQLKEAVKSMKDGLNTEIQKNGANLSVGQKQLICLARAVLKKSKILIIDEATANVDYQTDALIQKAIRECFKDCTVITIAHRLQTIMDSDKILCLSNGSLMNYGHPYDLLQDQTSVLYELVDKLSEQEAEHLRDIARIKYENDEEMLLQNLVNKQNDESYIMDDFYDDYNNSANNAKLLGN